MDYEKKRDFVSAGRVYAAVCSDTGEGGHIVGFVGNWYG